jgi:hypothetical protein
LLQEVYFLFEQNECPKKDLAGSQLLITSVISVIKNMLQRSLRGAAGFQHRTILSFRAPPSFSQALLSLSTRSAAPDSASTRKDASSSVDFNDLKLSLGSKSMFELVRGYTVSFDVHDEIIQVSSRCLWP